MLKSRLSVPMTKTNKGAGDNLSLCFSKSGETKNLFNKLYRCESADLFCRDGEGGAQVVEWMQQEVPVTLSTLSSIKIVGSWFLSLLNLKSRGSATNSRSQTEGK